MPNTLPPPPPGYSASDIVPSNPPLSGTGAPPPPPGYGADDIVSAQPQAQGVQPQSDEIQINPNDNFLTKVVKGLGGTVEGLGEGVFGTAAGLSDFADNMTGTQPGTVNQYLHTLAGDNDQTHGTAQQIGKGLEFMGELFSGDEALKGLSLADKLSEASKVAKLIEKYPTLTGLLRGAAVGATVGGLKDGTVGAITTGVGGGLFGAGEDARSANREANARVAAGMSPEDAQNPVEVAANRQAAGFSLPKGSNATSPEAVEQVQKVAQDAYHQSLRNAAEQAVIDSLPTPPAPAEGSPAPAAPAAEPLTPEEERVASYIRNAKGQVGDQPLGGQPTAQAPAPVAEEAPAGADPDPFFRYNEPTSQSPLFDLSKPINPGPAYAAPDPVYSEAFGRREGDVPAARPTEIVSRQVPKEGEVLQPRVLEDPSDPHGWFTDGGFVGDGRGVTDSNGKEFLAADKVNLSEEPRFQRDSELVRNGDMDNADLMRRVQSGYYDKPEPTPASKLGLSLVPKPTTPEEPSPLAKALTDEAPTGAASPETPLPLNTPAQPFTYEHPKTMRDVFGKAARTVLGQAKGDFQALDDASGGRWQRFNDQIENVQNKMDEVSGIDDEAYTNLQQKRAQLEANQAKMVESMKAGGEVDPAIADRAQALYRKSMALNDVNKAVQMSTERQAVPGSTVTEKVNAAKLSNRLQKLNDTPLDGGPSRLEQALGQDGAKNLIDQTDWTNMVNSAPTLPSTGQGALRELLRNNTRSTPSGVKTDWNGVLKDLDAMGTERQLEAFNSHLPTVRKGVQSRARMQKLLPTLGKFTGYGSALGFGDFLFNKAFGLVNGDKH